nr:MAG TPA: hypothetical protein [Caudoviricetes sp.]
MILLYTLITHSSIYLYTLFTSPTKKLPAGSLLGKII